MLTPYNTYTIGKIREILASLDSTLSDTGCKLLTSKKYMLQPKKVGFNSGKLDRIYAYVYVLRDVIGVNEEINCGFCSSTIDISGGTQTRTYIKKIGDKYKVRVCNTIDSVTTCNYEYEDIIVQTDCNLNSIISEIQNYIDNLNCINC